MDHYKNRAYKLGLLLVILVASSIATYLYWGKYNYPVYGIDDANIYFVYMRNLAHVNGFVYNVGGEHVEGFTSFLWVLIGSVFYLFSSKPEIALIVLNVVMMSLTIWRCCLFADSYFNDRRMISPYSILITGFILLIPGYVQWCTFTIMETGLWSCLIVFLFLGILQRYVEKKENYLSIYSILVLLPIARPEGYLWGVIAIVLIFFLSYKRTHSFKTAFRKSGVALLLFGGTIAVLTFFRIIYFGYPFPNTYYAKISADHFTNFAEGKKYVQQYFIYYTPHIQIPVLAVIFSLLVLLLQKRNTIILFLFPLIITIVYLIPLYTGGDHFGLFRFIQPYVPLFPVFYVLAFFSVMPLRKGFWYIPVALSLIGIFFSCKINFTNFMKNKNNINVEFLIALGERQYAGELNEFLKYQNPLPTYGVIVAGASAYIYKGNTIDLLGLNNVKMAHSSRIKTGMKNHGSFNKEVFFEQMPDLFFGTRVYRDTGEFEFADLQNFKNSDFAKVVFKGIWDDKRYKDLYFPVFIFSKYDKRVLQTHTHQGFLNQLDTSVYSYERIAVN